MDHPRLKRNVTSFFPEQIALALSTSSSSMWISWITGEAQIGLNVTPYDPKTVASEYGMGRKVGRLWNYTSGIIHHVKIDGLEPETKYYYKCGDSSLAAMSDELEFEAFPLPAPNKYPR
ncbi:hypothetical protein H5410_023105 [Solanum commersonii]|uniref:Purple acid phosphatase N-terminal domain-containing protein n=1 Tax=Solanum commersonii TaxID=4109 RepID=A0A9J5ZIT0_SOLCO|nr:hypothetical protein H5410_023105 [Solanum commersonii]